jgi:hypothetical protein
MQPSGRPTTTSSKEPLRPTVPLPIVQILPSYKLNFKQTLFYLGSFLPTVETVPNFYLNDPLVGNSYIVFGFRAQERENLKEITFGSRDSLSFYSPLVHNSFGLIPDREMSRSTVPIGDVNVDSREDLLICDPTNSFCRVYFGQGKDFFQYYTEIRDDQNNFFGWATAKLLDVNRDGCDDIAIASLASNSIYLIWGNRKAFVASVQPNVIIIKNNTLSLTVGIRIIGSRNDENTGLAVSSAGDFNSDGYSDIVFSAMQNAPYQNVIYILYLNSDLVQRDIILDTLIINKDYFKIIAPLFSFAGFSLSNLGDINQDGFDDVIIGSVPYSGKYLIQKSYVIYGKRNSSTTLTLSEITAEDGFVITGGGFTVGGPGDVNGDGIPDIMISSYEHWQEKGNSYIMIYPDRNSVSPPATVTPSSQPTSTPSFSPSSAPTNNLYPSSTPTFEGTTTNQLPPVNEATFPPFLPKTQSPTLAPKTSKPTRTPSKKPSTHSPTVKTNPPSVIPSRNPIANPTRKPSMIPTTVEPSRSPTNHYSTSASIYPSSFPSLSPTESFLTPFHEVVIDKEGNYDLTASGKSNFIISGNGSITISISNWSGKKMYTILPSDNMITITDFNQRYDQINLMHFRYLYSMNDLVYETNPLQLSLAKKQKLILSSLTTNELTEDNFIFHKLNEDIYQSDFHFDLISMISLGICISCVVIFGCVTKLNRVDDNLPWKEGIEEESEIGSSDLDSLLLDSSDDDEDDEDEFHITESEPLGDNETESEDDWNLFSSLKHYFSSENEEEEVQEYDRDTFYEFEELQSNDTQTDTRDIKGNYEREIDYSDDELEDNISFIQQLFTDLMKRPTGKEYESDFA